MKDEHKNMLLGFLAAKSQNQSHNDDLKDWPLNMFQSIWMAFFAWLLPIIMIMYATYAFIQSKEVNILGTSFEGERLTVLGLILGSCSVYIWWKIIKKFPRLIFWLTFTPPFIFLLIWLFDIY
jgi:hypothetical protein|tara:strand:- start:325 stop:693 length:369 start_codon:yes stop_codon:yes gene_type:complete